MLIAAGIALLAGCSGNHDQNMNEPQDIKQLVNDYSLKKLTADNVSITSQHLIVTEGAAKKMYSLPEDEFFVSIAPYVEQTHPCAYHNFTSCQGELVNASFEVFIEDEDGNVVVDEVMQTEQNGFMDLWLPRDKTFKITITKDNLTAESRLSTFNDDPTCITTIQLK